MNTRRERNRRVALAWIGAMALVLAMMQPAAALVGSTEVERIRGQEGVVHQVGVIGDICIAINLLGIEVVTEANVDAVIAQLPLPLQLLVNAEIRAALASGACNQQQQPGDDGAGDGTGDGSTGADASDATDADATGTDASDATDADATGADASDATDADATGADATGADSTSVDATGADATGSDSTSADATGADATGADSTAADATGADATGADSTGTDSTGSDSTGADGTAGGNTATSGSSTVTGLPETGAGNALGGYVWPAVAVTTVLMLLAGQFVLGAVRNRDS